MTEPSYVAELYLRLKRIYLASRFGYGLLLATKALIMAVAAYLVLAPLLQSHGYFALLGGIAFFLITLRSHSRSIINLISRRKLPVYMDFTYPMAQVSPYAAAAGSTLRHSKTAKVSALDPDVTPTSWQKATAKESAKYRDRCIDRLFDFTQSLLVPLLILLVLGAATPLEIIAKPINQTKRLLFPKLPSYTLTIESGRTDGDTAPLTVNLSKDDMVQLEVLSANLLKIAYTNIETDAATTSLDIKTRSPFDNSFSPELSIGLEATIAEDSYRNFAASFALTKTAYLFVPQISTVAPVAEVTVKTQPVPIVELIPRSKARTTTGLWPDEEPFRFEINVKGFEPIEQVNLIISRNNKTYKELVTNVMDLDKKLLKLNYKLQPDTYVSANIDQLTIKAEAIDRTLPYSLKGYSKPITIKTASAYGRYLATLRSLNEAKGHIDRALEQEKTTFTLPEKIAFPQISFQANNSPFFDNLDRMFLNSLNFRKKNLASAKTHYPMQRLRDEIADFLFEHEIINDRERDRDFFVALRTLSRLIDDKKVGDPAIPSTIKKLQKFLTKRQSRWQTRIEPMAQKPKSWPEVKNNLFTKELKKAGDALAQGRWQDGKATLNATSNRYEAWLKELEAAEDAHRAQKEQEQQQKKNEALAKLKEIQKEQAKVSIALDKAPRKATDELQEKWAELSGQQRSTMAKTTELEALLKVIAAKAAERIAEARTSMGRTIESGEQGQFPQAESHSDFANRLLRQARSEANRANRRRQRLDRRRRVTGDNYYGSRIVGGDIEFKRTYQVNRKYREDVLEQIQKHKGEMESAEQRKILEDYMFRVIK